MRKPTIFDKLIYGATEVIFWSTFVFLVVKNAVYMFNDYLMHTHLLHNANIALDLGNVELFEEVANAATDIVINSGQKGEAKHIAISFGLAFVFTLYRKFMNDWKEKQHS